MAHVVAAMLRPGAVYDSKNFRLWESHGYHITPVHFYSPIPDSRNLEEKDFRPSDCSGIDFRPDFQLKLLKDSFAQFSSEYNTFPIKSTGSNHFHLNNDAFTGIDPYIYYCMIRNFKPRTVIEVGSGNSTLLGVEACQLNASTRYVVIDPWPRGFISENIRGIEIMRQKVEDINVDMFLQLQENDILFVDGSHVVRTKGDVCFIILEILPRLARGVIIHFHDIFLPFDYPKELIVERQFFWTEQYLLQAYLTENCSVEVLFSSQFISSNYTEEVKHIFPNALGIYGGSFWIRKC